MRITAVEATPYRVAEAKPPSWLASTTIANPMSIYPRYHARRSSWTADFPPVLIRVRTDEGVDGVATAFGGDATAAIVTQHLARLLVGEDPRHVTQLWDQMFRATLPYGRKGLPIMAISAVDEALWDAAGRAAGLPVYQLLGGACRESLPVYQTTNDRQDWQELEGVGIKLAIPYGPADGTEGLARNVRLIAECRQTIGESRDIMLDCYMAFDVEYTRRLIGAVEPLGVRWIEEPLPPDDYKGYEALGKVDSPVSIATGEHEFTRWGFTTLIDTGGVRILQPDVNWVGGLSEARRICLLASSHHLMVVPHAGGLQAAALHLMLSQVNTPLAEWVRTWDRASGRSPAALAGVPDPAGGRIAPTDAPGLGLTVTDALVPL